MEELTPYLRLHIALDVMEQSALTALQDKNMSQEHPYYSAIVDYVHNSRVTVNNTDPKSIILPQAPQKSDFITNEKKAEKIETTAEINSVQTEKETEVKPEKVEHPEVPQTPANEEKSVAEKGETPAEPDLKK